MPYTNTYHSNIPCKRCKKKSVEVEVWDSSDGAYTDYKTTCLSCGYGSIDNNGKGKDD